MKMLEWVRFFEAQQQRYGKRVFTVTELANAAQSAPQALNVELSRLMKRGLMRRYARGRYGAVAEISPEELLPFLDSSAYITGLYALHRHNRVMQAPVEITCFTNRRHNRSRERSSPLGKLVFVCVSPRIYSRPAQGLVAGPEQALCDFLYLTCRKSLQAQSLVTFRGLESLNRGRLSRMLEHYPETVAAAAARILEQRRSS
jgi:hypothetical protein